MSFQTEETSLLIVLADEGPKITCTFPEVTYNFFIPKTDLAAASLVDLGIFIKSFLKQNASWRVP